MAKNILFCIIDILKDTDELNKYTRKDIERRIKECGLELIDRHTIRKCIDSLNDVGFDVVVEEGRENKYYLRERIFEEWEIKLICDMVCECDFLSRNDINILISKLKRFTSARNRRLLEDMSEYSKCGIINSGSTKYVVDDILRAIMDDRKISFNYCEYNDKLEKVQKEKQYIVNPYKLILKNGHYYLLLNKDGYEDVAFYRVDRMENVNLMDEKREALENVLGKDYEARINEIIKRRLYNYDGENVKLVIKVKRSALGEIIDNFYDGTIVLKSEQDYLTIAVNTTKSEGLYYWLMQHLDTIKVVKPLEIKDELISRVIRALEDYEK